MSWKSDSCSLRASSRVETRSEDRNIGRRETSWEAVKVTRVETMVVWTRVVVVKNECFGMAHLEMEPEQESRLKSCFW